MGRRLAVLATAATTVAAGAGSAPVATGASPAGPAARCAAGPAGLVFARAARARTGRLTWTGPAGLTYVVAVDGRRAGRTRARTARVRVAPGRRHRFSVVVARRGGGAVAGCRATRTMPVPFIAPSRPDGLALTGSVLSWRPSRRGDRPVAGYRVFRDGAAIGEVAGTRFTVPAAADPARPSTVTVVALDGRGHASLPSRALTIATGATPPAGGALHAFVLASTGSSFEDFKAHDRQIGAIHATFFECDPATGAVTGHDEPRITTYARLRQVEVYARFDCQSPPVLHRVLTDPALRGAWLRTMTGLAVQNGYDGVNLDFEAGAPGDRAAYTRLVAELAARLHAVGKKLAVDVSAKTADDPLHPRSGIYDYPELAAAADVVFVMAWGIHWATSAPGAIADMPWLRRVVRYVDTLPDRDRYVMGSPLYGMDWPREAGPGAPARALEWSDVLALSARVGAPPVYDATARETRFAYTDASGVRHQVWATNAAAVLERMRLFRAHGYGVGVWRLGREDQALWADPLLAG
jgi:spore germination protein YaaH